MLFGLGALPVSHTGEAATFWVCALLAVPAAITMVAARKAVHSALCLALVMISLAVLYVVLDAPFLAFVQIIVYTGAVLMLFLFVLMLVGVDSSDSLTETIRGQRVATLVLGAGFLLLVLSGVGAGLAGSSAGSLAEPNADGNVLGIAQDLFSTYVLAFEVTSALLITAALGAMVLAHRESRERLSQKMLQRRRVAAGRATPATPPGVYATHNAVDTPGLLPDGTPSEESVHPVFRSVRRGDRQVVAGELEQNGAGAGTTVLPADATETTAAEEAGAEITAETAQGAGNPAVEPAEPTPPEEEESEQQP
ncbi:MAG: NADH-quinone oxidoreductase subunit J [Streptosporangiales bacterium]|nr:NADH-quinone oxidoreductase subunit J [Streptosporangiales bacterium]